MLVKTEISGDLWGFLHLVVHFWGECNPEKNKADHGDSISWDVQGLAVRKYIEQGELIAFLKEPDFYESNRKPYYGGGSPIAGVKVVYRLVLFQFRQKKLSDVPEGTVSAF